MNSKNPTIALLLWMTAAFTASFVGMQGTLRGLEVFYPSLHRPAWNPPMGAFAPVWTVLYGLMGWAVWRVWLAEPPRRAALVLWWVQLVLNVVWPWLFFAFGKLGIAFGEIVVLWFAILATVLLFARKDKLAAWLLMPYLGWTGFVAILNLAIWRLN